MIPANPSFLLILLILAAGFPSPLAAQSSKADSLMSVAAALPEDTAKMRILWKVATLIGYNQPDSAYALLEMAVAIGNKFPGSNAYKADALHAQAVILQRKGDWQQSETKAKQILRIVQPMHDQARVAHTYNMLAITHGSVGRFDSAVHYYMLAIDLARPLGDYKVLVTSLGNLGAIYGYVLNDVPKGLISMSEAVELAEKHGFKDSQCGLYSIMGGLLTLQGDYKTAIGYYLSAIRVAQATDNIPAQAEAHANVADAYMHKEMPEKAEQYARKALEMNAASKSEYVETAGHITLARALNAQKKYAEALGHAEPYITHPDPITRRDALENALTAAKGMEDRSKARTFKDALDALQLEIESQTEVKEDIRRIERQHGLRLFARRKD